MAPRPPLPTRRLWVCLVLAALRPPPTAGILQSEFLPPPLVALGSPVYLAGVPVVSVGPAPSSIVCASRCIAAGNGCRSFKYEHLPMLECDNNTDARSSACVKYHLSPAGTCYLPRDIGVMAEDFTHQSSMMHRQRHNFPPDNAQVPTTVIAQNPELSTPIPEVTSQMFSTVADDVTSGAVASLADSMVAPPCGTAAVMVDAAMFHMTGLFLFSGSDYLQYDSWTDLTARAVASGPITCRFPTLPGNPVSGAYSGTTVAHALLQGNSVNCEIEVPILGIMSCPGFPKSYPGDLSANFPVQPDAVVNESWVLKGDVVYTTDNSFSIPDPDPANSYYSAPTGITAVALLEDKVKAIMLVGDQAYHFDTAARQAVHLGTVRNCP